MPTILQHRRGTTSQNNAFTGALGEISVDTDLDTLRVHDGTTAGGFQITQNAATQTLTNKTLTTPVITEIDSGSTITLDATTDIVLDAGGADIILKDDGTTFGGLTNTSANLIIKSGTTTMLTGSGANATFAGNLTVSGDLDVTGDFDMSDANLNNVGSISLDSITGDADANTSITFSGSDVITIATGGSTAATFNASQVLTLSGNMVIPDDGTIGSASDTNAIAISSGGVVAISATTASTNSTSGALTVAGGAGIAADLGVGDDLRLISDSAILSFGADSEIALTHVHNTGLLLTDSGGSPTLQLTDAGESISSDGSKLILTSNSVAFSLPTADGNAGQFLKTNGSAVLSFDTVSSAADDLTAGDAAVTITTSSGNITIDAAANDSDLIIKGTDNNADITMATFDGSDAGTLILNHDLELGTDGSIIKFGADNEIALTHVADSGLLLTDSGGGPTLQLTDANESISSDGSNLILTSGGTAFTIPASDGNANQVLATNGSGVLSFATASANTPSSADGQALGSASLEWSDLFLADGGTVTFGNDQDVILTHVADVGLTLSHVATADNKPIVLQLKSEEDDIAANEIIASLEFAAGDSDGTDGATVAAGIHAIAEGTFSASANATKLVFTTGVSETAAASATAKMTLSSVGLLTVADDIMIKDGGTIGVASTNDAITISSAGIVTFKDDILIKDGGTIGAASATTAITIASSGIVTLVDDLILKDAATIGVASSTSAITIASTGIVSFVDDIIIKDAGTIGSASAATAITIASSGIVTLVDDLILKDAATIGVTSSTSAISIASTGIVTFVDDILIKDAGTIGSASDPDAIAIGSDGDVTLTQDLELQHDGAILSFGADDEVSLTHVHDAGLLLNSTNKIQFNDASQFIHAPSNAILDIAATDEIELTATTVDVVGAFDVTGASTVVALTATGLVTAGAKIDLNGTELILDANGNTSITADTDDQIDIRIAGADDFTFTANTFTAVSGSTIAAQALTATTITASGIIKTDDSTAATSTTDGSLQTDGGLSVVLDAVIGDDIIMISDAAQIAFGVNSEITLAHVHNVGLTLTHATAGDNLPIVLQLKSEEDIIVANEVIASIEFAAGDSDGTDGATVAAGIHAIAEDTFSASANATKLVFTTGVSETAASSATAKMTLSSAGLLTIADDFVIKDGGTIGTATDADAITIAEAGGCTFSQTIVASNGLTGTASAAVYGDLAEKYIGDQTYSPGTVMQVGGTEEITAASASSAYVAGVISTLPGFLMNSELENGQELAFVGRVPTRVTGSITKGQPVFADNGGVASNTANGPLVGLALESSSNSDEKLIECMLKV